MEDIAEKQTKALENLNTDQQLKLFGDLFSKKRFNYRSLRWHRK